MNKPTRSRFPFDLPVLLLALALLSTACGGPARPTATALPPDVARPQQPTPDFDDSADLFNLAQSTRSAPVPLPLVEGDLRQPGRSQVQSTLPVLPMRQLPTALGIVRTAAGLRQSPGGALQRTLPAGTTLTVTGRSSGGELLAVFTGAGLSGWVATANVTLFGADDLVTLDEIVDMGAIATLIAAAMQPVELPTRKPEAVASESGAIVVGDVQLAVRTESDPDAAIIGYLEPGQGTRPLARRADNMWLLISTGAELGWIPVDAVKLGSPLESLPILP